MKRFTCLAAALGLILAVGLATTPVKAQLSPERAGAFYFGESAPGDGFLSPADLSNLGALLKGTGGSYTFCEPEDPSIQDLDADTFLSPGDKAILAQWVKSLWPAVTGRAAELYIMDDVGLESATDVLSLSIGPDAGDSLGLSARAYDANNHNLRAGFGVLFTATSVNPACLPVLKGHNPLSELTTRPDIIQDDIVHAFLGKPFLPEDGWANISILMPSGCSEGDTIRVATSIPNDTDAGVSGNRQPNAVVGPAYIITVSTGGCTPVVAGITIDQADPLSIVEGAAQQITATCSYTCGVASDDCTLAGGIVCSSTGDLSEAACLLGAGQILGPNGGSGSVTAWPLSDVTLTDTNAVTVTNDDTLVSSLIEGAPASAAEGAAITFTVMERWSDGFTVDLTAGSLCAGGCTGADGSCTASQAACGAAPAACSITDSDATNSPVSVTITNDDTISSTLLAASGTGVEGSAVTYTVNRTWSDTCVEDMKAGATCTGGCTGTDGSGLCTMSQATCGAAPAACVVTDSDATNSPQSVAGVNDDTISSTLITGLPGTAAEGALLAFAVTRTWSDACAEDLTTGSTCAGGCTGSDGLCTASQAACGAAPAACSVADSDATNSPVSVTITNDDTITSTLIGGLPASANEGAVLAFAVTRTWSDTCTEDMTTGSTCAGGCTGSDGICTISQALCGAAPADCSVADADASNSPQTVTGVNDDTQVSTLLALSGTGVEGSNVTYTVTRTWSDTCTEDMKAGATCSGGCSGTTGSGTCTMAQVPCAAAPAACVVADSDATNSPQSQAGVNDDTIVSTLIAPIAPTLAATTTQQFTLTRTYSDTCTVDLSAGAGWSVTGTCTPAGTIGANGLYTAPNVGVNCSESVNATLADGPATVSVTAGCIFDHNEVVAGQANVAEGGAITFTVDAVDSCAVHTPIPGATVSVSGDCTQTAGGGPGTLNGVAPGAKTAADTSNDTVNGIADFVGAENTPLVNAGAYTLTKGTVMSVNAFNVASIPAGSTINSVSLKFICGRNGATLATDYVYYNIGAGAVSTGLGCYPATTPAYLPEQTISLPITTLAQLNALVISFTNSVGGGGVKNTVFDTMSIDIAYTSPGTPGISANQVPCGAGGSCTLSAVGATSDAVTVDNDDTISGTLIGTSGTGLEGSAVTYTVTRTWSDTCTEDMKAGAACSGGCSGTVGSGTCTMAQATCGTAPAACVVTDSDASNSPQSVAGVNDDTISSTLIAASGTGVEGSGVTYTVTRTWSDTCTEDMKAGAACGGGCTGVVGSGACVMSQANCGAAPAACTITDSDATNSPQSIVGVNDDTIASTLIAASGTGIEGSAVTYTVDRTWSDTCVEDMKAGATCGGGCTGAVGSGTCTMSQVTCSGAPAACSVTDSDATNSPQSVNGVNDDTVSTVAVLPAGPVSLGNSGTQAFTCTATFSDACTENCITGSFKTAGSCTGSTYVPATGLYTAQASGTCNDTVGATWLTVSDATPTTVNTIAVTCVSVTIDQADPLSLVEGANQAMSATCLMSDSSTQACAGTWSVTGNLTNVTNTITAAQVPCGAGGTGTVSVNVATCTAPTDTNNVTVTNNDTISSTLIAAAGTGVEGSAVTYTVTRTWSDTCTEDMKAGATCGGGCTGTAGSGTCTMSQAPCGAAPAACTVTDSDATNSPQSVAGVNNDTISSTLIAASGTGVEGSAVTYTVTRTWNDTCTEDMKAGATCGGGCTGTAGSGTCTMSQATCGTAPAACTVTDSDATNSPQSVAGVNDDTISSTLIALAGTGTEGTAVTYTVNRTWSDACVEDMKAGATCGGGCTGTAGSGTCTMSQATCGTAPAACTVTDSDATNSPQSMAGVNNDTISSTLIALAGTGTEGTAVTYTVTRTWSDACTEDMKAGATCSGGCTGAVGGGTCTMSQANCMAAPAACAVTDADATNSPQSMAGVNNDTVSTVAVTPASFSTAVPNATQVFACLATCNDTFTENCLSGTAMTGTCGTYAVGTGTWTAPGSGTCNGTITGTWYSVSDATPATVSFGAVLAPSISYVFPLRATTDDRYRLNAHPDQHLTVVMDYVGGGVPATVTTTCTGPTTVNFTCTGSGADPDWDCTPTSTFTSAYVSPFSTYTCTVSATNGGGTDNTPATANAALSPAYGTISAKGGMGQGYIGSNLWDSATNKVGAGTIVLTAINEDDRLAIAGKVYVQLIQGSTISQYFTDATGNITITGVLPQQLNELTMGYKCGKTDCEADTHVSGRNARNPVRSGYYNYYQYQTFQSVDAQKLILPIPLMSTAWFGRNKAVITGTLNETSFRNYIGNRPVADTNPRVRPLLIPPTRLRVGLVVTAFRDTSAIAGGLDALLLTPDSDTSIAVCLDNNPTPKIDQKLKTALPVNLIAPELLRTDWRNACNAWNVNTSLTKFQVWSWTPGEWKVIWALGAYANASNFSLVGGIDLFGFPIYGCAIGAHGLTINTSLRNAPFTSSIGTSADFEQDLREDWDNDPLGYDFDTVRNRKYQLNIIPRLPLDPARVAARTYGVTYKLPNLTDSELNTKFTLPNWDQRFYRKALIIASGGDFGPKVGIGITGLALNAKIDDAEFTIFAIGYFQSTGTGNYKMGTRNVRYWLGSTGDTEVAGVQQSSGSNGFTDLTWGTTTLDWNPVETGGPTNYAAIMALSRGMFTEAVSSSNTTNPSSGPALSLTFNSGSIVSVWHIGDPASAGNEVIAAGDFINMPTPIAPATNTYIYPAPQWSNTLNASQPTGRNGEMWPDRTVDASNSLPTDAAKSNRYYVEFSRVGLFINTGRTSPDLWKTGLSEPGEMTLDGTTITGWRGKPSAESTIDSSGGLASGTGVFQNIVDLGGVVTAPKVPYRQYRWLHMGIQLGDSLVINSHKADCNARLTICRVDNDSQVTVAESSALCATNTFVNWATLACTDPDVGGAVTRAIAGITHIKFRFVRAYPRGEQTFDDLEGRGNNFWTSMGPGAGTGNIRVHVPVVTPGAATLNGTTGVIPDLWEGLPAATQLSWSYSEVIFNTDAATLGGMGRDFNWNNRDFLAEDTKQQWVSSDSRFVRYQ